MNKMFKKTLKSLIKKLQKVDHRIWIIGALVLTIVIGVTIIFLNSGYKNPLHAAIYDPKKPIPVEENGVFGYVDFEGEMLIEPQYETADPFYGDFALVKTNDETSKYKIIDRTGAVVKESTTAKKPKYYKDYGVWLIDNILYDYEMNVLFEGDNHLDYVGQGYFTYFKNDEEQSGLINHEGKKIFAWNSNYISVTLSPLVYDELDEYAAISDFEEQEKIISLKNGKEIYTLDDPKNKYLETESDNVFRIIDRQNSYKTIEWLYIENDRIVYSTNEELYDLSLIDYKNKILRIDYGVNYEALGKTDRYVYYDTSKKVYTESLEGVDEFTNRFDHMEKTYGYKTYTCNGLYGLLSKDKVIVDCKNDDITFPTKSLYEYLSQYHKRKYAIITDDTKITLYDLTHKKETAAYELAAIEKTEESSFLYIVEFESDGFTKSKKTILNLITGRQKTFSKDEDIEIFDHYMTVRSEEKTVYYDVNFEVLYETNIE